MLRLKEFENVVWNILNNLNLQSFNQPSADDNARVTQLIKIVGRAIISKKTSACSGFGQ